MREKLTKIFGKYIGNSLDWSALTTMELALVIPVKTILRTCACIKLNSDEKNMPLPYFILKQVNSIFTTCQVPVTSP